jgi:hypothetical protein
MEHWDYYFEWELLGNRQGHAWEFARKITQSNPEVKALYANCWLIYVAKVKYLLLPDLDERWAYDHRADIVKKTEKAYADLTEMEPANWLGLNNQAFYAYKQRDMRVAQKALKAIGDHWVGTVWPKEIFVKAQDLSEKCLDCAGTGAESCGAPGCIHGMIRCPNHCLQIEDGEWVHMHHDGHPDTDLWQVFGYVDKNNWDAGYMAWSQAHIGHLIKVVNGNWTDTGICPLCHGTGWIECPVCHGKDKCKTCNGTGNQPGKKT